MTQISFDGAAYNFENIVRKWPTGLLPAGHVSLAAPTEYHET